MGWSIVEQHVLGKIEGMVCEDMVVATEHHVAVIDGASDATGERYGDTTGGKFAADVIAGAISQLDRNTDARGFADAVTNALATAIQAERGDLETHVRRPAAAGICFAVEANEVWRIGDCHLVLDGEASLGGKAIDDATTGFRAAINTALMRTGVTVDEIRADDPGRQAARQLNDLQQQVANWVGPWGYGCINGTPVPDEFVEVIEIAPDVRELVMTSDGYPVPGSTLADSEAELARLLAVDPAAVDELWRMGKALRPGAHGPDDRAYVRLLRST